MAQNLTCIHYWLKQTVAWMFLPVAMGSEVRGQVRHGATVVRRGEVRGRRRRRTTRTTQLQCWHIIHLEYTSINAKVQTFICSLKYSQRQRINPIRWAAGSEIEYRFLLSFWGVSILLYFRLNYLWVNRWLYLFVQGTAWPWLSCTLRGNGRKCFWEIIFVFMVAVEENIKETEGFTWLTDCSRKIIRDRGVFASSTTQLRKYC